MAAEGMEFSWRWNGGMISLNLGVIWEMSVNTDPTQTLDTLSGSKPQSSKRGKTRQLGTAFALVFAVGLFAHWPALISDSVMWDDWIMLAWITQTRLDWSFQHFHNYGVTPFVLVYYPFIAFVQHAATSLHIAKMIYVAGTICCGILVLLISARVAHGNLLFATFAGVSAVCFPGWSGEGFHISALIYSFFIPLFLVGILLFIAVAVSRHRRPIIRVIALSALFLSFSFNALLVVFYALVPPVFYASFEPKPKTFRAFLTDVKIFLVRHLDFLALPFVFWILKEIFMPREGIFARYNALRLDWSGIIDAYFRLVPDILQSTVVIPFSVSFSLWAATIALVVVVLSGRPTLAGFGNDTDAAIGRLLILCGLGFLVLFGTALPYYIVGRRTIQAFGFMSRDNALFPLPVGWISGALFCILLKAGALLRGYRLYAAEFPWRRVVLGAFAAVITVQSLSNWRNHADWQSHYAYYRSVIEKVARNEVIRQASVIQVIDKLPGDRTLKTWKYPTSIWTGIISHAFQNNTTRLAIPFPPDNGRFFTRDEINRRVRETEVAFMLGGIDLDGQQIRLTVEPGSGARNSIRLALAYWRARFLAPADMPKLLDSLTQIRSERIGGE